MLVLLAAEKSVAGGWVGCDESGWELTSVDEKLLVAVVEIVSVLRCASAMVR